MDKGEDRREDDPFAFMAEPMLLLTQRERDELGRDLMAMDRLRRVMGSGDDRQLGVPL